MRAASALVVLVLLAACDGAALDDRTYPPASDFPEVTVADLFVAQAGAGDLAPGSYNVTAFVSHVNACPRNANCFVADHVVIVPSLAADPVQLSLIPSVQDVRQFREGARYLFSVVVEVEAGRDGALVRVVGYDRL